MQSSERGRSLVSFKHRYSPPFDAFLPNTIVGRAGALGDHEPDVEFIVQSLAREALFVFVHHEALGIIRHNMKL